MAKRNPWATLADPLGALTRPVAKPRLPADKRKGYRPKISEPKPRRTPPRAPTRERPRPRKQTTISRSPFAGGALTSLTRPIAQSGSFEAQHLRQMAEHYRAGLEREVMAARRSSTAHHSHDILRFLSGVPGLSAHQRGAATPPDLSVKGGSHYDPKTRTLDQLSRDLRFFHAKPTEQVKAWKTELSKTGYHGAASAPATKALDALQRVNYAEAGATDALLKGKGLHGIVKAAGRGIRAKDRTTFGTVLRAHHVPGAALLGFGLDVLLDPATYVTFGMESAAAKGAAKAAREASAKAERVGVRAELKPEEIAARKQTAAAAAARQHLRKAERHARPSDLTRGVDVRIAGRSFPGVARGTARVRAGAKHAAAPVSEGTGGRTARRLARRFGSEANANVRPFGQTLEEKHGLKGLGREARAGSEKMVRDTTARANSLLGHLADDEQRTVIDAIERNDIGSLRAKRGKRGTPNAGQIVRGGGAKELTPKVSLNPRTMANRVRDTSDPDRLYIAARNVRDDLRYLHRQGQRSGLLSTGVGPQAARRIRSVGGGRLSQAQNVGVRSQAKVRQALTEARKEQASARVALRQAKPGSERIAAKRALRHAEDRVENLRQRYNAIGHQRTSVYARQQGAKQAIEPLKAEAQGYFPRLTHKEVDRGGVLQRLAEPLTGPVTHVTADSSNRPVAGSAMRREKRQTRADIEKTPVGQLQMEDLSQDVRGSLATYGQSIARASSARHLNTRLLQQMGKPIPKGWTHADVIRADRDGYGIYRVRRGVLEQVDPHNAGLVKTILRNEDRRAHPQINPDTRQPFRSVPAPRRAVDPKTGKAKRGAATEAGGQYAVIRHSVVDQARNIQPDLGSKSGLLQAIDATQSKWKGLVLSTPAWLIRNLTGDGWNAWLDERSWRLARNMVKGQKALNELGRYEKGLRDFQRQMPPSKRTIKLTEEQAAQVAKEIGPVAPGRGVKTAGPDAARQSPVAREVPAMAIALLAERMGVVRQGRFLELMEQGRVRPRGTHAWQNTVKRVEDSTRIATFLGGLQRGLNPREAAQRASELHFDYGDLTTHEKALRRLAPFYTFSARNIPLQGKKLVTRPGKFAALAHAREEGRQAAGLDVNYEGGLNPFEQRQLGIPVKWRGKTYTVSMGSPFVDLNDATAVAGGILTGHPLDAAGAAIQRSAEMLTPLLKIAPELKFNYSTFYRDQIQPDAEPYTRAPEWAVALAKTVPWFKKAAGLVDDYAPTEGPPVWGWPRKADYVSRALLPGAIGQIAGSGALGLGVKGANARALGIGQQMLAGLGTRAIRWDHDQAQIQRVYDRKDEVDNALYKLRRRTAPGSAERISVDNPTPEFTRLYDEQSKLEQQLYQLQLATRPGGIVKGRRQGNTGALDALRSLGGGTRSLGGGTRSLGGGTRSLGGGTRSLR